MHSLAHWNFAESFSGQEIALLLIGCDPAAATELDHSKARAAYQMVRNAYYEALGIQANNPLFEQGTSSLKSKKLRWYERNPPLEEDLLYLDKHLVFESQVFLRQDIVSWIKSNALISQYSFDLANETPKQYRERVARTVEEHKGNKSAASKKLGISPQRVGQLVREHGKPDTKAKPLSFSANDPFNQRTQPSKGKPIK